MADTTIGGLATAATALAVADLIEVEQGAASKKATLGLVKELCSRKGADVASAGTLVLGDGDYFHITGTTTITDIDFTDTWNGRTAKLVFDSSLLLTYNATTLILPGKADIRTSPGDSCFVTVDAGDNVKVVSYERVDSPQLTNPMNSKVDGNQSPAASATTLLIGSVVDIPNSRVRVKTVFRYSVFLSKTGAGTVAIQFLFKIGTAGTTADATVATFNWGVGTAAIDAGRFDFDITVIGPITSACVTKGEASLVHGLAATGLVTTGIHSRVGATIANFDATVANLKASLSIVLGASYVVTVTHVIADTLNL